jgi:DNA-binding XRE family transcriptional regulator
MPRKKRAEKNPLVSVRQPAFIPTEYVARLNWEKQNGENLKVARLDAKYSREWFAVQAGCSKQYIQNIEEASVSTTGYPLISKMCELLGVSLMDILEGR